MTIIVNAELSIYPYERHAALALMHRILPDTWCYDSCHWYNSATNIEDARQLEILSTCNSKDGYYSCVQWRLDTGVTVEFAKHLDEEPQPSFLMAAIHTDNRAATV